MVNTLSIKKKSNYYLGLLIAFIVVFLMQVSVSAYEAWGGFSIVKTIGGYQILTIGNSLLDSSLNVGAMPTISTGTPTNVGETLTLNGNISDLGSVSSTYAYFQWWYSGDVVHTTALQTKTTTGSVSQTLTFDPNKVLNVRMVANVGGLYVYGATRTLSGIQGNSLFRTLIPIILAISIVFVIVMFIFMSGNEITFSILAGLLIGSVLVYYVVTAIINLLF